jgi:thiol-disulfide isomerase/thioredoxin
MKIFMKKTINIFAFVLMFSSVIFAQKTSKTNISGKILQGVPNGKVMLSLISETGVRLPVDSAVVAKDLTFSLNPVLQNGGGFYQLDIFDQQKSTLILEEGDMVKVLADGRTGGKLELTGSINAEYYKKLNDVSNAMKAKTAVLEKGFQEAIEKKDVAKQEKLRAEYMAGQTETINKIKGYFPEMGTKLVMLYATNFLNPEEEVPFLKVVAEKFEKTNSTNPLITTFINKIKKLGGITEGAPSPEITLRTPEGDTLSLSSLKGKYVLIDFWASWCGPCRRENPNVVKMYEKFKGKPFEIFGVSLDKDHASWIKAIKADNLGWKHVSDLLYWQSSVVNDFGIKGIPQTYLLDKEGVIIAKNLRGPALEAKLDEVLGN